MEQDPFLNQLPVEPPPENLVELARLFHIYRSGDLDSYYDINHLKPDDERKMGNLGNEQKSSLKRINDLLFVQQARENNTWNRNPQRFSRTTEALFRPMHLDKDRLSDSFWTMLYLFGDPIESPTDPTKIVVPRELCRTLKRMRDNFLEQDYTIGYRRLPTSSYTNPTYIVCPERR